MTGSRIWLRILSRASETMSGCSDSGSPQWIRFCIHLKSFPAPDLETSQGGFNSRIEALSIQLVVTVISRIFPSCVAHKKFDAGNVEA